MKISKILKISKIFENMIFSKIIENPFENFRKIMFSKIFDFSKNFRKFSKNFENFSGLNFFDFSFSIFYRNFLIFFLIQVDFRGGFELSTRNRIKIHWEKWL